MYYNYHVENRSMVLSVHSYHARPPCIPGRPSWKYHHSGGGRGWYSFSSSSSSSFYCCRISDTRTTQTMRRKDEELYRTGPDDTAMRCVQRRRGIPSFTEHSVSRDETRQAQTSIKRSGQDRWTMEEWRLQWTNDPSKESASIQEIYIYIYINISPKAPSPLLSYLFLGMFDHPCLSLQLFCCMIPLEYVRLYTVHIIVVIWKSHHPFIFYEHLSKLF